jgi:hypothetical protein
MLNNLTNLYNLIKTRQILKAPVNNALVTLGVQDSQYDGGYKPMAITTEDLLSECVQSVTGLNTDNTDPQNPIVKVSVDNTSITGLGTPASPLVANIPDTLNYGLFTQTVSSTPITNTIVESSLISTGVGSLSVPANAFQVGDSFHAKLIGHLSCNGSATLRLRVKSGTVILADTGVINMEAATNKHWEINIYFTVRTLGAVGVASIASGGIFSYTKNSGTNFEGTNFSIINNTTFDTTVSNTLTITAEWGAANAADSIYSEIFTLSKTY